MGIKDTLKDVGNAAVAVGGIAVEPVKSVAHSVAMGAVVVGSVVADAVTEKVAEKKELKKPIVCSSEEEFKKAMSEGYHVIVVENPLYDEILEEVKEIRSGKNRKGLGAVGIIAGLLASGGLGIILLSGGVISIIDGNNKDSQKEYKVKIDELKKEITFTLK